MEGNIPEIRLKGFTGAWVQRRLGDILKVNSGRDYKHLNCGDIPVYGTGGYMLSVNDSLSEEDAVGIGRKGTIDKPQFLKAPFWTVDTLFFITPKPNNDLGFLFALSQDIEWAKLDESTSIPSLSKTSIDSVLRYVPEFDEQTAIGEFFRTLDENITLHKRKLDGLREIKKGYLQQMFPQVGETVPRVRFEGFTDTWEWHELRNVANFFNEKRVPIDSRLRTAGEYPYYGATGIIDYVHDYIFDGEYVLLAEDGANIVNRNSPIAYLTKGKFWLNNHAHIMAMKSGDNSFLLQLLEKQNYKNLNTGTAQPKLNSEVVKKMAFLFPEEKEQTAIGDFFRNLENQITTQSQKVEQLKQLKAAYLQKMFV